MSISQFVQRFRFRPTLLLTFFLAAAWTISAQAGPPSSTGGKGPKPSIEVVSTCSLEGTEFKVKSEVTADNGIIDGVPPGGKFQLLYKTPKKGGGGPNTWTPAVGMLGGMDLQDQDETTWVLEGTLDLCNDVVLPADATALNAEVTITFTLAGVERMFFGQCDDPNPDDEIDQSNIDVPPNLCD